MAMPTKAKPKAKPTKEAKQPGALTPRQRRFVDEYLIDLNATQAAIRAGYKAGPGTDVQGVRLLANARVKELIAERMKAREQRTQITQDAVLQELARLAFFDVRRLVGPDGNPLSIHQLDDDTARAVVGLDVAKVGNMMIGVGEVLKFKIADKRAALVDLGKHLGMFKDKVELSGPGGSPLQVATVDPSKLSTETLAEIMAARDAAERG